jgi:hypothetical protein
LREQRCFDEPSNTGKFFHGVYKVFEKMGDEEGRERNGIEIPVVVQEALDMFNSNESSISWASLSLQTQKEMIRLASTLHALTSQQLKALSGELSGTNYRTDQESAEVLRENISVAILYAFLVYLRRPGIVRNFAVGGGLIAAGASVLFAPGIWPLASLLGVPLFTAGASKAYKALIKASDENYSRIERHLANDELMRPPSEDDIKAYEGYVVHWARLHGQRERCELDSDCRWHSPGACKPAHLKSILLRRPSERNKKAMEHTSVGVSQNRRELHKKLLDKVDALLSREDVDRDVLEVLLAEFGVKVSDRDSEEELRKKLRNLVLAIVMRWLPSSADRLNWKSIGGIHGGMIGAASPFFVVKYLMPELNKVAPIDFAAPVHRASFSLAVAVAILGYKTVEKTMRAVGKYKLDDEEIDSVLERANIDEWFVREPNAATYAALERKCETPGACHESDATCQRDTKDGRCRPNVRLQVRYRPYLHAPLHR